MTHVVNRAHRHRRVFCARASVVGCSEALVSGRTPTVVQATARRGADRNQAQIREKVAASMDPLTRSVVDVGRLVTDLAGEVDANTTAVHSAASTHLSI